MKNSYYIGLDAHKSSIAIAYAIGAGRAKSVFYDSCCGSLSATENALRKLVKNQTCSASRMLRRAVPNVTELSLVRFPKM